MSEQDGFTLDPDAGWYERHVKIRGRQVAIRSGEAPALRESARALVEHVLQDPASLSARFHDFKIAEGRRSPREAEEIEGLELEAIDFFNPDRPSVGEVSFSEESGGETWTCLLEGGTFRELSSGT